MWRAMPHQPPTSWQVTLLMGPTQLLWRAMSSTDQMPYTRLGESQYAKLI